MLSNDDLQHARTLPARCYVQPAFEALEREHVFARHWQLVGHASEVSGPGDHVPIELAGVPLIVLRGEDGVLRALHNVCRHRAGPLVLCPGRGARALRCRYHGWTYTLEGQLRSAPEMQDAADFELSAVHLPQAEVAERSGLIWARIGPTGPALDEVLESVLQRLDGRSFAEHVFHARVSYDIACNWKTYVDNYLEGYHLPHVHPGLNRLLDYRQYQTELATYSSLQYSPLAGDGPYRSGEALYWFIYPNIMLNVLPDRLQTNRVLPLGAQRCRVEFDFYYPVQSDAQTLDEMARADRDFSDEVQREDIGICEQVQIGLASGSYEAGRLNPRRESALKHFQDLWRADLEPHALF